MVNVADITGRFERLASDRAAWDNVWREIIEVCFPTGPRMEFLEGNRGYNTTSNMWTEPRSATRGRRMYDATGAIALDRVTAGIESLITPQGQTWHELAFSDPIAPQPKLDEEEWMDRVVHYLFGVRYDPRSGWLLSHQRALTSVIALGTGVYYCGEAFGSRDRSEIQLPMRYQPIPLNEAYLACDDYGEHDTMFRCFQLTAAQSVQKFGDKATEKAKKYAADPKKADEPFKYLHATTPKGMVRGTRSEGNWSSVYLELDSKEVINASGFFEFPFCVYTWTLPTLSAYGESPAMVALPEMKTLQAMSRDSLLASQLGVRPPVATAYELDRPVNLNPGAINPKMIDPNTGRPLVAPVMQPGDPRFFEATMELRRQHIRQALFVDLFAVLVDKPNMSATEAMIRSQEKGELLGPAASRIQTGLARLINRELGILERKGAFQPGSLLAPPQSMQGRDIDVKFNSPIDRARNMSEVTGMQQSLEFAAGLAQFAPEVLDNVDADAMYDRARYLLGAPPKTQRDPDTVKHLREERANKATQQEAMMGAQGMIDAAGGLGPAAEGMGAMAELLQNAGINPAQVAGIPRGNG